VNLRHGVTTILGCFFLFGASSIAAGIQSAAMGAGAQPDSTQPLPPTPAVSLPPPPDPNYDPYAGASVPRRR
jgi:hypothetical protein